MANYISSNANRFYAAVESAYGVAAAVNSANRMSAVQLQAHQVLRQSKRRDKTGTRSYLGSPATARRQTAFEMKTYLMTWDGVTQPSYGPLLQSALGAAPQVSQMINVAGVQAGTQIQTVAAHGLSAGSAISTGTELRFVSSVVDTFNLTINAPFSVILGPGALLAPTISYKLSTALPSVTLYDYWDPAGAVSRLIAGAAVDSLQVSVNGDYHELAFTGPAADLVDSRSFTPGAVGLSAFPLEPALADFDYSIVPGQLGQVWLGTTPTQFFTLTEATVELKNNLVTRNQEFGSTYPRSIAAGPREVNTSFTLFAQDDPNTTALYAAAKLRQSIPVMLQLGQQQGQIMGLYLPAVIPEIPEYNDSEPRLLWNFKANLAQGVNNDELFIAFA